VELLTEEQRSQLLENGRAQRQARARGQDHFIDFEPVVRLFTPADDAVWLLTELSPNDPDVAFGLCDLGVGFPEIGYVSLSELEALRGPFGLPVERDLHFQAKKTLSEYAKEAYANGCIVT
jgi:hypothetical protein